MSIIVNVAAPNMGHCSIVLGGAERVSDTAVRAARLCKLDPKGQEVRLALPNGLVLDQDACMADTDARHGQTLELVVMAGSV